MTQVIILEDHPVLREELAEYLGSHGHRSEVAGSVAEFMRLFRPQEHKVAVIDLGLPDGDGLDLILRMRRDGMRLGIIILTARSSDKDRVNGLVGGADYFLSKTASLSELEATIEALARRMELQDAPKWLLQHAPRQLTPPGFPSIALSGQDFEVLRAIAGGKEGEFVSRMSIVEALGANFLDYDMRRLDTQMKRLRRKVEEACGMELPVTTLRNGGYRFHVPVEIR